MPMFRYFLFVGGALLGLLFLADWYFPLSASEAAASDVDRTIRRTHSRRQWPAAMPIDTSVPMPKTAPSPAVADNTPGPLIDPPAREALAYAAPPPAKTPARNRRRATSRFASRETHRRLASSQGNWFATW